MGRKLEAQGDPESAVSAYNVAISLNDSNPGSRLDRAIAYLDLKENEKALADFDQVVVLEPKLSSQIRELIVSDNSLLATWFAAKSQYPALGYLLPTPTKAPTSRTLTTSPVVQLSSATLAPVPSVPATMTPRPTTMPPTPKPTFSPVPSAAPEMIVMPESQPPGVRPPDKSPDSSCPDEGARIAYPPTGSQLRGQVVFTGTASIPNFLYYKIEVRRSGAQKWDFLLMKDSPVTNGTLFTWNTRQFESARHDLRLIVVDKSGNYVEPCEAQFLLANLPSPVPLRPEKRVSLPSSNSITLTWGSTSGASYYGVEVQCLGCCTKSKWCPDQLLGPITTTNVSAIRQAGFAQRWRVWAVDHDGYPSQASPWIVYSETLVRYSDKKELIVPPGDQLQSSCITDGVRVTRPITGSEVRGWVTFQGTADIPDFSSYKVEWRPSGATGDWSFILQRHDAVRNGVLFEWDTRTIPSGRYDVRLVAVDKTGNYPPPCEVTIVVTNLNAPLPVSPQDQAQLWSPYSQSAELIWTPVEGAAYYGVEVECFNCTGREEWSPWAIEGPLTSNSVTIIGPTSEWQTHRVGAGASGPLIWMGTHCAKRLAYLLPYKVSDVEADNRPAKSEGGEFAEGSQLRLLLCILEFRLTRRAVRELPRPPIGRKIGHTPPRTHRPPAWPTNPHSN